MTTENYKLIQITGSDAGDFLQGQLTQDIERVARTGSLPAAWCNPKGRVVTVLRILEIDGGYGLILPASLAETVNSRLTIFRFRADVEFEIAGSDWTQVVFHDDEDMNELKTLGLKPDQEVNATRTAHELTAANVGIEETCVELFGNKADFEKAGIDTNEHADSEFLAAAKIRAGIPVILENTSEKYTPHMLNLDLLGAISFEKGCYTGQEVVARTQNLGSSKRRLMRYSTDSTLTGGDRLSDGEKDVGEVINVIGSDLLAVTPVDVHDKTLFANGVEVTPVPVSYL
jgi:folate-binding protein YgfZ